MCDICIEVDGGDGDKILSAAQVPRSYSCEAILRDGFPPDLVCALRIIALSDIEAYSVDPAACRNEATVLSVLFVFIRQQQRCHVITQSQRSRSHRLRFSAISGFGYGCIATEDVEPGDVVVTVPAALVISSDAAMDSSCSLRPLLAAVDGLDSGGIALLFALCENAQPDSEWRLYFDFLPRDFQTPLQWSESELQLLQGTPLLERVVFECETLRQFYDQLFPTLSDAYPVHYPATSCTWDVFLWLRCLFDSRAFHLKSKDGSLMPALLPGADMFNYSLRPHVVRATTIRKDDSGSSGDVEFAAAAGCSAGQQVFHMYSSDLSNAELLLSYGFTIPDNENDTVMVDIEPPDEAWRTRLLPFTPQHYLTRKAPLPLQLQHAVALACCSKIELKNRLKEGVWAVAVQRRALQLLLEMLQEKRAQLPALPSNKPHGVREHAWCNACAYTAGQAYILDAAVRHVIAGITSLDAHQP